MRLSWRVFLANAAVLIAATFVLAISPVAVSLPIGATDALALGTGLVLMLAADLAVLRRAFAPFESLGAFMRAVGPSRLGRRGLPVDAAKVEPGRELVDRSLAEVRQIACRLRSVALDELGFKSALVALTTAIARRDNRISTPLGRSPEGNGIRGLRERVLLVDARLDIGAGHREATCVRLTLSPRRQG